MTTPISPIIGLMGKKRSGKDTVADYLVSTYGFVRVAFADPLKRALLALDPIIDHDDFLGHIRLSDLIGPEGKSIRDRFEPVKDIPEVRHLLQRYGVLIRELQEDFWVDVAMIEIDRLWEANAPEIPGFVIPDVRFPNEYLAVQENGLGVLWRVERSGLLNDDVHVSETALDGWHPDATVLNGGTLADLYLDVDKHLEALAAEELLPPFKKISE